MDIRPLLQLTTVMLAVGALAYYGYGGWDNEVAGLADDGTGPDYIIDGMEAWQGDEKGHLIRHFEGTRLVHKPQPELFEVHQPVIRLYSNGKPLWHLRARNATSPDPARDIWLLGQVVATRDPSQGQPLRIETPRLHANPRINQLDTPDRVHIIGPQGQLSGTGLTADMQGKTLQFSSAVEVRYAPSSP